MGVQWNELNDGWCLQVCQSIEIQSNGLNAPCTVKARSGVSLRRRIISHNNDLRLYFPLLTSSFRNSPPGLFLAIMELSICSNLLVCRLISTCTWIQFCVPSPIKQFSWKTRINANCVLALYRQTRSGACISPMTKLFANFPWRHKPSKVQFHRKQCHNVERKKKSGEPRKASWLHVTDNLPQLFALQLLFHIPANALLMQAVCGSAALLSLGLLIEF